MADLYIGGLGISTPGTGGGGGGGVTGVTAGTPLASSGGTSPNITLAPSGQVQGDILYFNGTNWVRLPAGTSGNFLQTQGASANPQWAAGGSGTVTSVGATSPIASSGGATPTISMSIASQSQGDVLYFDGTSWVRLASGTSGQFLQTQGASANPQWASGNAGTVTSVGATSPIASSGGATPTISMSVASQAQGDILYFNGTTWVRLGAGTSGNFLQTQGASANPQWASGNAGTVTSVTASSPIASSGGATPAISMSVASQAQGDILYFNGTNWVRLGAGTSGNVLQTQGAGANPQWASAGAAATTAKVDVFTSSGTYTKPTNAIAVKVKVWGAGGGGGGGQTVANGTARSGGGGGGGGSFVEKMLTAADLSSTVTVTCGTGGTGGSAGVSGTAGGTTSFGTYASAYGGGGAFHGVSSPAQTTNGGGGGGTGGVGFTPSALGADSQGGLPNTALFAALASMPCPGGLGACGAGSSTLYGGAGEFGGGGGGGCAGSPTGYTANLGGTSLYGGGGGGSGSGSTTGGTALVGAAGGATNTMVQTGGGGGAAGTTTGAGGAGASYTSISGGQGGGGGGQGGTGGAGGLGGGGGGGGGASPTAGGTGGAGGGGVVLVYTWISI